MSAAPSATTPLLRILACPTAAASLAIDAEFLRRNRGRLNWLQARLQRSTAGVRGMLTPETVPADLSPETAENSPQLTPSLVALIAQGYADYLRELEPRRQSAFVGFDARFLSPLFGEIFTRVLLGNGLRVARDLDEQPTATPVTSFMANFLEMGAGIQITASHNPPNNNGVKSSTGYGGVDPDDVSARIAAHIARLAQDGGRIPFAALPDENLRRVNATGLYRDHYLHAVFPEQTLTPLREALDAGAEFLFDGLHGVGGATMRVYLDGLLGREAWEGRIHLLNERPDPRIGGIARPDPGDPKTLELSGAIEHLVRRPQTLLSVTADMDADRIGLAVIIPADRVAEARRMGLFVSEFRGASGAVWALRFTPNQVFSLLAHDRLLSALQSRLGVDDPEELQRRAASGESRPEQLHLISTIATTQLAQRLAAGYSSEFHATAVGFKYLGLLARNLDREQAGDLPLILMEESGGAQIGPFAAWNERGDTIHRDKDTCALAMALFCLAARRHRQGRSLLDSYQDLIRVTGILPYSERLDIFLPDRPTAEDPQQAAAAEQIKLDILERLMALASPAGEPQLCQLLGFAPQASIADAPAPLEQVSLLLPAEDGWALQSPTPRQALAADGSRLQWFRAGAQPHDGLAITHYDPAGQVNWWCLIRASGTEPILRVYLEILEDPQAARPGRLGDLFAPLLRHLGLHRYRLEPGAPDYLTAFAAHVRSRYAG